MRKSKYKLFGKKSGKTIAIVLGSMTAAFVLGIQTAGEVKPIVGSTEAGGTVIPGDLNGDNKIDPDDVKVALELSQGDRSPTPNELAADPNKDYKITQTDVEAILEMIKFQN